MPGMHEQTAAWAYWVYPVISVLFFVLVSCLVDRYLTTNPDTQSAGENASMLESIASWTVVAFFVSIFVGIGWNAMTG